MSPLKDNVVHVLLQSNQFKIKADTAAVGSEYLKYYISCSIRIALFNEKLLRSWQQKRVQKRRRDTFLEMKKYLSI